MPKEYYLNILIITVAAYIVKWGNKYRVEISTHKIVLEKSQFEWQDDKSFVQGNFLIKEMKYCVRKYSFGNDISVRR